MSAVEQRFWMKVERSESGCWLWTASKDSCGYGTFKAGSRTVGAHRFSYELANGPIPAGLTVDHMCYVRNCVNPTHLRLLTAAENTALQRPAFKTHCVNGHEYTTETLYREAGTGWRTCRICNRAAVARYKNRQLAAARAES